MPSSGVRRMRMSQEFDPEGTGYDDQSAFEVGLTPDEANHMPSRVPNGVKEGLLLKGRRHETWHKTEKGEEEAGYEIFKSGDRYYSHQKRGKGM